MGGTATANQPSSSSAPPTSGLKKQWDLKDPPPLESGNNEKAIKFVTDFKAAMEQVKACLLTTKINAEKTKHDAMVTKRDQIYTDFPAKLAAINKDEAQADTVSKPFLDRARALGGEANTLRLATEKSLKAWQDKEPAYTKSEQEIGELEKAGDKEFANLRKAGDAIRTATNENKYDEAVRLLAQHLGKLKPVYDAYQKQQKEAKAKGTGGGGGAGGGQPKPFPELQPLIDKYLKEHKLKAVDTKKLENNGDPIYEMHLDEKLVEAHALTSAGKDSVYNTLKAKLPDLVPSLENHSSKVKDRIQYCWLGVKGEEAERQRAARQKLNAGSDMDLAKLDQLEKNAPLQRGDSAELDNLLRVLIPIEKQMNAAREAESAMTTAKNEANVTPETVRTKIDVSKQDMVMLSSFATSCKAAQDEIESKLNSMQYHQQKCENFEKYQVNLVPQDFWHELTSNHVTVKMKVADVLAHAIEVGLFIKDLLSEPAEDAKKIIIHFGGEQIVKKLEAYAGKPKDLTPAVKLLGESMTEFTKKIALKADADYNTERQRIGVLWGEIQRAMDIVTRRHNEYAGMIVALSDKVRGGLDPKVAKLLKAVTKAQMSARVIIKVFEGRKITDLMCEKFEKVEKLKAPIGKLVFEERNAPGRPGPRYVVQKGSEQICYFVTIDLLEKGVPLLKPAKELFKSAKDLDKECDKWAKALLPEVGSPT